MSVVINKLLINLTLDKILIPSDTIEDHTNNIYNLLNRENFSEVNIYIGKSSLQMYNINSYEFVKKQRSISDFLSTLSTLSNSSYSSGLTEDMITYSKKNQQRVKDLTARRRIATTGSKSKALNQTPNKALNTPSKASNTINMPKETANYNKKLLSLLTYISTLNAQEGKTPIIVNIIGNAVAMEDLLSDTTNIARKWSHMRISLWSI